MELTLELLLADAFFLIIALYLYWDLYKYMRVYRFGKRFKNIFRKKHIQIDNPLFESSNFTKRIVFVWVLIVFAILFAYFLLEINGLRIRTEVNLDQLLESVYLFFPIILAVLPFIIHFFLTIPTCILSDSIVQNEKGFLLRTFGEEYFLENEKFTCCMGELIAPFGIRPCGVEPVAYQVLYFTRINRSSKDEEILCLLPATTKNKQFIEQNLILEVKI